MLRQNYSGVGLWSGLVEIHDGSDDQRQNDDCQQGVKRGLAALGMGLFNGGMGLGGIALVGDDGSLRRQPVALGHGHITLYRSSFGDVHRHVALCGGSLGDIHCQVTLGAQGFFFQFI